MKNYDFKVHWNKAYKNSERENLGWFENDLSESFNLIQKCKLSKDSRIFNAGAGESLLIKKLQKFGYSNILINDIISYSQIILAVVISIFYFIIGVTIFYISYAGAKIRGTLINVGE